MRSWDFDETNTISLLSKMSEVDRSLFQFDMTRFKWFDYFQNYTRGIRLYIFKDPMETLPEGIKRLKKSVKSLVEMFPFNNVPTNTAVPRKYDPVSWKGPFNFHRNFFIYNLKKK